MKKNLRRFNFNMVEVMLAVIVVALGIAGVFVLFPVGLNANKEATAENSIADIAEYVTAFVRAEALVEAIKEESGGEDGAFDMAKINDLFHKLPADDDPEAEAKKNYQKPVAVDNPDSNDWEVPDTHSDRGTDGADAQLFRYKKAKGVYLVRQLSGPADEPFVDFAAVARIYLDKDGDSGFEDEQFLAADGVTYKAYSNLKGVSDDFINKFLLPVVLELSWPATAPEAEREKRYFRFEIFNDQYEQSKESAGGGA